MSHQIELEMQIKIVLRLAEQEKWIGTRNI